MKKILLATIALSMFATPAAFAQQYRGDRDQGRGHGGYEQQHRQPQMKKHDYRKRQRRPSNTSLDDIEEFYLYDHLVDSGVQPGEERPEDVVVEQLTTADVSKAIDELPEEFRQVVVLADVEGFAYREIADIVGIPVGTVISRLFRARRRLRRQLHDLAVQSGYIKGLAADG